MIKKNDSNDPVIIEEEVKVEDKEKNNNESKENNNNNENKKNEDEEEEISIEDEEYNKIKDPNVRKLFELDFEKTKKDEILQILLKDSLYLNTQKKENDNDDFMKINKTQNKHFRNIVSPLKNYLSGNNNQKNYYFNRNENKDFNIKTQNNKLSGEKENEVLKKLLPIQQKNKEENNMKKENETQKIENFEKRDLISNKNKKIDKRTFNQFLQDEKNHLIKINNKIKNLKEKKDSEEKQNYKVKPNIDKNSELIYNKKKNSKEKVYERLYNLRNKSANKKRNEEEEKENKKLRPKTGKIYIPKKPEIKVKIKPIEKKYLLQEKNLSSYKIFFNYFINHFRKTINNYFNLLLYYNEPINDENINEKEKVNIINNENIINDENIINNENIMDNENIINNENNENNDFSINNINSDNLEKTFDNNIEEKRINHFVINKLSLPQLYELLYELGICSKPLPDDNDENENPIQEEEKMLVIKLYEILKDEDEMVENDKLLKFLISVLGLHYYDLYREFKIKHKESEIDSLVNDSLISKDEKIDLMINTQNNENEINIDPKNIKENDYVSYDKHNKIIIPISKSKIIKKEFHPFLLNYMNLRKRKKNIDKQQEENYNFKPNISQKSEELYEKYKEKIIYNLKEIFKDDDRNYINCKINNLDCVDRLFLQDKRRILENEKIKDENIKKEMEKCTFKPKINNYSSSKEKITNRFDELIIRENEKKKHRRNKTKDEIDLENNEKEYTFKPNISFKNPNYNNFSGDIYGEDYQILYERMKNGRLERLIKEAVHDRYDLNEVLKNYIKKNKENIFKEKIENDNLDYENYENEINNENISNTINQIENIIDNKDINEIKENEEKKEGIPLLIIDVNIRQGVKKKIYVYEGDTPEALAEKFANEHNLEKETKDKLQNLIHNHMLRLLTRIDEER